MDLAGFGVDSGHDWGGFVWICMDLGSEGGFGWVDLDGFGWILEMTGNDGKMIRK